MKQKVLSSMFCHLL